MEQAVASPFTAWESFYVIIGSASAVLMGLQFVVVTLSTEINAPGGGSAVGAFSTPTIVHFCAVLTVAAIVSAPWPSLGGAAVALGVCAVAGVVYTAIVTRRARRVKTYKPVLEDWLCHVVLPFASYGALVASAVDLQGHPERALFVAAAAVLLLLLVGIHNAWDTATYVTVQRRKS